MPLSPGCSCPRWVITHCPEVTAQVSLGHQQPTGPCTSHTQQDTGHKDGTRVGHPAQACAGETLSLPAPVEQDPAVSTGKLEPGVLQRCRRANRWSWGLAKGWENPGEEFNMLKRQKWWRQDEAFRSKHSLRDGQPPALCRHRPLEDVNCFLEWISPSDHELSLLHLQHFHLMLQL